MKKNKNLKVIGFLVLTLVGVLFGHESLQDFDNNYEASPLDKIENFLSIFYNPYELR